MKRLAKLLAGAADQIEGSLHPRISIAWQTRDMVYTDIYSVDANPATVGKRLEELYRNDAQTQALAAAKRRVVATGATHHGTYTLTMASRRRVRVYDMTIQAIKNETGEITGLMTASVDMTDIYDAQKRLSEANERLLGMLDQVLDSQLESPRKARN